MTERNLADVVVLGAGIAGATAAHVLARNGLSVIAIERGDRVGGSIRTMDVNGFLIESGPNTIQKSSPDLEAVFDATGLSDAVIEAAPAATKRFVVRNGRPRKVPSSPVDLFRSELLSWKARVKLLIEPFVGRAASDGESVADFVRRRLGDEFLDYGIEPFVAGVHAGDPEKLSLRQAFPAMHRLEDEAGSLILGAIKRKRAKMSPPRWKMFTVDGGLASIPVRMLAEDNVALRTETTVETVTRGKDGIWITTTDKGSIRSRYVISTLPLNSESGVTYHRDLAQIELPRVTYAPVAVVALAYPKGSILHPMDGFGMLVPMVERSVQILGTLFVSSIFPGRSPRGEPLLTTFIGGMRHPHHMNLSDIDLVDMAHKDNGRLLGVTGSPVMTHVQRWHHAIPQYNLGYSRVLDRLTEIEESHPGIGFAGNYRNGVSVTDTLSSGFRAAERCLGFFAASRNTPTSI
jgi:protoporphyrinogen/coproporphyrinogen III oxidase